MNTVGLAASQDAATDALPRRAGQRPGVTRGIPHSEIGAVLTPELNAELLRRIYALPGVVEQPTAISTVPGTRAFWLAEDAPLARPEALVVGRELGHVHPDGSLHVTLPPDRAREAIAAGWADTHPLTRRWGIDSYVLLFTPRSEAEVGVISGLVADAHAYVTGASAAAHLATQTA